MHDDDHRPIHPRDLATRVDLDRYQSEHLTPYPAGASLHDPYIERVTAILEAAHVDLAADNARAQAAELERDLGSQSAAQQFDDMRHELARIAVALGRSRDGTGLDCDWHDLAGDVETIVVNASFRLPREDPPPPRAPYAGWQPGAADCVHASIVNDHCTRCGRKIPD